MQKRNTGQNPTQAELLEAERILGLSALQQRDHPSAVVADPRKLSHINTYGALPGFYLDRPFTCRLCGKREIWKAADQKWYYEEAKGHIDAIAVKCHSCRTGKEFDKSQSSALCDNKSAMITNPAALQSLCEAADGLLVPSETDAPFEPFCWPDEQVKDLTPERARELASAPADTKIECVSIAAFFRDATREQEWHNAEEAAQVQRFKALVKAIKKTLDEPRVFRVGETEIDCYIAGGIAGGVGGLKTQLVET